MAALPSAVARAQSNDWTEQMSESRWSTQKAALVDDELVDGMLSEGLAQTSSRNLHTYVAFPGYELFAHEHVNVMTDETLSHRPGK